MPLRRQHPTISSDRQHRDPSGRQPGRITGNHALANCKLLTLSGATIPASNSCTVSVNVTSVTAGIYANSTGPVSSANAVTGDVFGPVNLTVVGTTLVKSFNPGSVAAGQPSTMRFIITNNNATTDITGVAFNDTFPTAPGQMEVAATPNLTNTCGGSVYRGGTTTPIAAGDTSLSFTGGAILRNGSCTITIDVTVPAGGSYTNTSSQVTTANAGTGTAGTANLVANMLPAPTTAKSFLPAAIGIGMPSTLKVTLTNNSASAAVNEVAFTDTFPSSPGRWWCVPPNRTTAAAARYHSGRRQVVSLSDGTIPISGRTIEIESPPPWRVPIGLDGAVNSANASSGSAATASLPISGTTLDKKIQYVYATTIVATTTATLRFIITTASIILLKRESGSPIPSQADLVVAGPPSANSCGAQSTRGAQRPRSRPGIPPLPSPALPECRDDKLHIDIRCHQFVRGPYQNDSHQHQQPYN